MITMSVALDSQKYVVVEVKTRSAVVENDKPFFLFVAIKPISGVHINAQPPISIKTIGSAATINIKEVPEPRAHAPLAQKLGEYLDVSKPIEVECKLAGVKAGPHKLSFAIDYTYCSEKDGWCRMGKDTVFVTVRVKK
jgi:hypothetical protein